MSFAEKIYALRTENGLSQEVLADRLAVSRQAVSKWESGSSIPETDKLIILSDMFGVSLDFLLKDEKEKKKEKSAPPTSENLDRMILRFLGSAQDIDEISKTLIDIIQDGVVDEEERIRLDAIMQALDKITDNILDIKRKLAEEQKESGQK
jgi:transcriptional regulator with XRE-family HTH domain